MSGHGGSATVISCLTMGTVAVQLAPQAGQVTLKGTMESTLRSTTIFEPAATSVGDFRGRFRYASTLDGIDDDDERVAVDAPPVDPHVPVARDRVRRDGLPDRGDDLVHDRAVLQPQPELRLVLAPALPADVDELGVHDLAVRHDDGALVVLPDLRVEPAPVYDRPRDVPEANFVARPELVAEGQEQAVDDVLERLLAGQGDDDGRLGVKAEEEGGG